MLASSIAIAHFADELARRACVPAISTGSRYPGRRGVAVETFARADGRQLLRLVASMTTSWRDRGPPVSILSSFTRERLDVCLLSTVRASATAVSRSVRSVVSSAAYAAEPT